MNSDEIETLNKEDVLRLYSEILEEGEAIGPHYIYIECKRGSTVVKTDYYYAGYWDCNIDNQIKPWYNNNCKSLNGCQVYCKNIDAVYRGSNPQSWSAC